MFTIVRVNIRMAEKLAREKHISLFWPGIIDEKSFIKATQSVKNNKISYLSASEHSFYHIYGH